MKKEEIDIILENVKSKVNINLDYLINEYKKQYTCWGDPKDIEDFIILSFDMISEKYCKYIYENLCVKEHKEFPRKIIKYIAMYNESLKNYVYYKHYLLLMLIKNKSEETYNDLLDYAFMKNKGVLGNKVVRNWMSLINEDKLIIPTLDNDEIEFINRYIKIEKEIRGSEELVVKTLLRENDLLK